MIRWRTLALDLLCDMVGGILYAVGIYTFAKMANFAPGGLSGLALLMNYLWDLPIGLTTMAMNIPLVVLSYRFVGKKFLIKTMRSMAVCTIFWIWCFLTFQPMTAVPSWLPSIPACFWAPAWPSSICGALLPGERTFSLCPSRFCGPICP